MDINELKKQVLVLENKVNNCEFAHRLYGDYITHQKIEVENNNLYDTLIANGFEQLGHWEILILRLFKDYHFYYKNGEVFEINFKINTSKGLSFFMDYESMYEHSKVFYTDRIRLTIDVMIEVKLKKRDEVL